MSPDFYASYISGSIGILIGNPLDLIKVHLQSQRTPTSTTTTAPTNSYTNLFSTTSSLVRGTAAPILGYGALNAILFMTYNRTSSYLDQHNLFGANLPSNAEIQNSHLSGSNLWNIWLAGAIGGLATWIISTPTELIKCQAQLSQSTSPSRIPSSILIGRNILRTEGIPGLFRGGVVTALRDSIGYGFYFWSYELGSRIMERRADGGGGEWGEAMKVLLCGGVAGVVTWASVFPLDVVKTRVQTQFLARSSSESLSPSLVHSAAHSPISPNAQTPLLTPHHLPSSTPAKPLGAWQIARTAYQTEGSRVLWRGFGVCCVRAFIVNAVQWATYEWIMKSLGPSAGNEKEVVLS